MSAVILQLPDFEGSLELLYTLVQKNELDICRLTIVEIINQIQAKLLTSEDFLDLGAESISQTGNLLWIKSRALLPKEALAPEEEEMDASFNAELLGKLVEYCQFKEAAKALSLREERAKESYLRQLEPQGPLKKVLGIDHLSLSDLAAVFQTLLLRAEQSKGLIEEEEWRVGDKMKEIRTQIKDLKKIPFDLLFTPNCTKLELIVYFLAILELMKLGEIAVAKDEQGWALHSGAGN